MLRRVRRLLHRKGASMRPPQNAGESLVEVLPTQAHSDSFNEAPAERGGKFRRARGGVGSRLASMRPPQNAGESLPAVSRSDDRARNCFNEAPAERGGKWHRCEHLQHKVSRGQVRGVQPTPCFVRWPRVDQALPYETNTLIFKEHPCLRALPRQWGAAGVLARRRRRSDDSRLICHGCIRPLA